MSYILAILLSPFAALYASVMVVRNLCYHTGLFKRYSFNTPAIVVGNLRAGGVGKTPLIEYLITLLQPGMRTATLSRGYKRNTRGFLLADSLTTAADIGDEPMQIKLKFTQTIVSVCEKRVKGMQQLEKLNPPPDVVLLDDAFQHLALKAGLYILVTEYSKLFTDDYVLPAGRLREPRYAYKRAHIIVVSKCPANMTTEQRDAIRNMIKPLDYQTLVFAQYAFSDYADMFTRQAVKTDVNTAILLLTGIADNSRMKSFVTNTYTQYDVLAYPDHYTYTLTDIEHIIEYYKRLPSKDKLILTTEKDAVKLTAYKAHFEAENVTLAIQPMYVSFINDDKSIFDAAIFKYLTHGKPAR